MIFWLQRQFINRKYTRLRQSRDSARRRSLRRSRSLKVINFSTNRKPVCDFLSVNNTNLHPISHRFPVITQLAVKLSPLTIFFNLVLSRVEYHSSCRLVLRQTSMWSTPFLLSPFLPLSPSLFLFCPFYPSQQNQRFQYLYSPDKTHPVA